MAIKKSQDAKFQLHLWSKLLEGRIALQKVVIASRHVGNPDEATLKSTTKLLACLVKLRDTIRHKGQFNLNENVDPESYKIIDDQILNIKHDDYVELRTSTIEKWCEKTKIGVIPKKGYTALELPTSQLITNSLKDKDRLVRRTQIDRTNPADDSIQPEVFNDDDFYHQLLKEVLSKEEGRKWGELQRLSYKMKRKADTKATKGRKIKKDLIPKLINFMAPSKPREPIPEQIRNELMKSLFR